MAKKSELIAVLCPCCNAELYIDPETRAVIRHKEAEKPRSVADMEAAMTRFKGEAGRREEVYQKSVSDLKDHHKVLERKFEELF